MKRYRCIRFWALEEDPQGALVYYEDVVKNQHVHVREGERVGCKEVNCVEDHRLPDDYFGTR